jgi:hypothetical protein
MAAGNAHAKEASIMGRGFIQIYMTLGAIFGVILAGPLWYAALFGRAVPTNAPQIEALAVTLLIATLHGVLRAFLWLPSLVYNVGMHKIAFVQWLFGGWW